VSGNYGYFSLFFSILEKVVQHYDIKTCTGVL